MLTVSPEFYFYYFISFTDTSIFASPLRFHFAAARYYIIDLNFLRSFFSFFFFVFYSFFRSTVISFCFSYIFLPFVFFKKNFSFSLFVRNFIHLTMGLVFFTYHFFSFFRNFTYLFFLSLILFSPRYL